MAKDYTTIRVEQAAKDAAEEHKTEGETWSDYIRRCTDDPPEVREYVPADASGVDTEGLVADLRAELPPAIAEELQGRLR